MCSCQFERAHAQTLEFAMVKLNRILIVGGGIAGMSAAIQCARAGYSVELIEKDPQWQVLGAGLTVLGSTLRALHYVGVITEVREAGYFANGNKIYDYRGTLRFERPGMRMPDIDLPSGGGILRPVLHNILSKAVTAAGVTVKLGVTANSMTELGDGVEVGLSDGTSGLYGLVIAAEGLKSQTRQTLFSASPKPTFTGQGCWRLVCDRPAAVDRGCFYVGGPVTVGTVPVSQAQMYVWVLQHSPDNPWIDPATQHEILKDLLKDFGGVVAEVRDGLGANSTINYRPLEPLLFPAPWHRGHILLIGDTCHATTPHLASGAGMAIEDGVVIAQELLLSSTVEEALTSYLRRRWERCRLVVENSIAIGEVEMRHEGSDKLNHLMNVSQAELSRPF
jgi:2-polyprenyl-6-methoxyphenol hydroxylase-like FAD-dependent oxidoreductase